MGVDPAGRLDAEPSGELGAAGVRLRCHLDDRGADPQAGPGRQVVGGQIEVDDQLIAGALPLLGIGPATARRARDDMMFNSASGSASPSGVLVVSPFDVVVADHAVEPGTSSAESSTIRSPTAGRRTTSSTVPTSLGAPIHVGDERFELFDGRRHAVESRAADVLPTSTISTADRRVEMPSAAVTARYAQAPDLHTPG